MACLSLIAYLTANISDIISLFVNFISLIAYLTANISDTISLFVSFLPLSRRFLQQLCHCLRAGLSVLGQRGQNAIETVDEVPHLTAEKQE